MRLNLRLVFLDYFKMSRKPTTIGKFNQAVEQLLEICLEHYDDPKAIQYYQYQLELGQKSNPRMVIEKIMNSMGPYLDQIMTRDESFFLGIDLQQTPADAREAGLLDNLRHVWFKIDDKLKDKVWKYIQLAIMYGVMVTKNPQQLAIINSYRSTPLEV